ncbi:MAG: phage tail protein, partial [Leuconostoc mesenteroides]
ASGMERVISARGEALAGALINPIMNAKNPLFGAISKWVSDDRTEKEFNKVGESISHAFSTITEAFGKEFKAKDFTEAANKSLEGMAKNIERFGDYIAKHKDSIIGFFSATKDLSGTGFSVMGDTLKIAMPLLEDLGQFAQNHPKEFKIMAESIVAINLAFKGMHGAVKLANTVLDTFSGLASGIKWGAKVLGIEAETKAIQEQNAVLMENNALSAGGGVSGVGGAAKTAGTVATTAAGASKFGKVASISGQVATKIAAPIAIGMTGIDVGTSIATAISSNNSQDKIKAASKGTGTLIGASIGGILGSVIPGAGTVAGAALGGAIGDSLGSTKTAQSITSKLKKSFEDAWKKEKPIKINPPEVNSKSAYDQLNKAAKKYYTDKAKLDTDDLNLLKKNGLISDDEYNKRLAAVKKEAEQGSRIEKLSQSDRAAVTKYYAEQRQKVEEKYNKQKKSDSSKWDKQILKDKETFGANSAVVNEDYRKKDRALANDDKDKKNAINKLTVKNATKTTAEEAKAHVTAAGKIKAASDKQADILTKLTNKKGELTNKELQNLVNKSQKEYNIVKETADKKYKAAKDAAEKQLKAVTDAADKQYNKVKDSADKQYKHIKKVANDQFENVQKAAKKQQEAVTKSAEKQYEKTVDAGERQYKGNSKWAQNQRKKVEEEASKQKNNTINAGIEQHNKTVSEAQKQHDGVIDKAKKQHTKVVDEAGRQKNDVINKGIDQHNGATEAASKQRDDVVGKARKQRDDTVSAAKDQSRGVVSHATAQANGSMEAASKQGKGTNDIWSNIGKFFNGLVKGFGVKGVDVSSGNYGYKAMGIPAYATGTDGAQGGQALVGEAGVEARYSPYSGKIDLLGHNGAQVVNLNPGDKILNARDTAKLFQGGLGKTLPGYAKGTSSLDSFISSVTKGASNIWDDVSDAASDALSKITDPIKSLT